MTPWLAAFDASLSARLCLTLVHSLWEIGGLALVLWLLERLGSACRWRRGMVSTSLRCSWAWRPYP